MYTFWIAALMGCGVVGKVGLGTVVIPSERASKWEDALCNDGSPFGMIVSEAKPKSDVWVIKVVGGYFCDDEVVPCSQRKPVLTKGPGKPDGARSPMLQIGLHSRDPSINPDFYDANHVVMHYCSSDYWLGEETKKQETSGSSNGWHFSGRKNFDAALGTLEQELGMTDGEAKVLIAGHSAGGKGVIGNVPLIKKHLSKSIGKGDVRLIIDGSWVPRQANLDGSPNFNKWGDLDTGCTNQAEKQGTDPDYCFFGDEWYPGLKKSGMPVLIQQSTLDPAGRTIYGIEGERETQAWQQLCKSSFDGVDWLFSGAVPYHTAAFDDQFTLGDKGKTFQQVVHRFWLDKEPERVFFEGD